MKTTAIVCAVLAGSLGFSGLASAQQQWGGHPGGHRQAQAASAQAQPAPAPAPAQQAPAQRWQQHQSPSGWNGVAAAPQQPRTAWQQQQHNYQQPRYHYQQPRNYQQPRFAYNAPRYAYHSGYYGGYAPHFYRGGYLPRAYLNPGYYVDYRAYPGLYAPPYGYQWVNVDGEFMLVALATGLITNLLINGAF